MAENTLEGLKAAYRAALQERDEARVDLALATTGAAPVGVYARLAAVEAERDILRALLREWREADDVTQDLMLRTDAALEECDG